MQATLLGPAKIGEFGNVHDCVISTAAVLYKSDIPYDAGFVADLGNGRSFFTLGGAGVLLIAKLMREARNPAYPECVRAIGPDITVLKIGGGHTMTDGIMSKIKYLAIAAALLLFAGTMAGVDQAQAGDLTAAQPAGIELVAASAAANALSAHCSGSTRGVFRTTRGWIDFLVTNARQLTGRTFQQDLIDCAEKLPRMGSEGFTAIGALHAVCLELRASAATCKAVKRNQNFFITVRG